MDVQVGTTGDDYAPSYVLRQEDSCLPARQAVLELLRLKSEYYKFSDDLYTIYAQEYKKALMAELNNIYVALTRSQDELYVFLPQKVGNSFNLVQLLFPENIRETGAPGKVTRRAGEEAAVMELPASRYHDWIDYLKDEFLPGKAPCGEGAFGRRPGPRITARSGYAARSSILCFHLSAIWTAPILKKAWRAPRAGTKSFPLSKRSRRVCRHPGEIIPIVESKIVLSLREGASPYRKEIVNAHGHLKRLDRLIIGEKEIRIVDFKSSREGKTSMPNKCGIT